MFILGERGQGYGGRTEDHLLRGRRSGRFLATLLLVLISSVGPDPPIIWLDPDPLHGTMKRIRYGSR